MLSPRLIALLGGDLDDLSEEHLQALVSAGAVEDQDLDFKESMYEQGPKGTFEMAKDIAAFANHLGGLIIIGIREHQGRARHLSPAEFVGEPENRVRQVVAARVFPVIMDIRVRLIDAEISGYKYCVIAVPGSVDSPHGVQVDPPDRRPLSWPVRNGSSTRYMHEAELAARYRDRFSLARGQLERLEEVRRLGQEVREVGEVQSLLMDVCLTPGRAGHRPLGGSLLTIGDYLNERQAWTSYMEGMAAGRQVPRRGRLRIESSAYRAELHTDGSGWVRGFLGSPAPSHGPLVLPVAELERKMLGCILLLGGYAAWAGAGGACLLSAMIAGKAMAWVRVLGIGGEELAEPRGAQVPPAEITWHIEDLQEPSSASRAAFFLSRDIEQDLGIAEPVTISESGNRGTIA